MQLSILLLAFYCLNILCCLLALKFNIQYQIINTQRKIRFLAEKNIKKQPEQKQRQKLHDFWTVYTYLFKRYTLIGLSFNRNAAHSIVILLSFALSFCMVHFGIHWALGPSLPLFSSLTSIIAQYEYYKCIFLRNQQQSLSSISKLMSTRKVAIVIYTFMTMSSLGMLLFLIYSVSKNLNEASYLERLVANGLILGLDSFIYKPLIFILASVIASQSPLFLSMIEGEEEQKKKKNTKKQLEIKVAINFSQQQLNEFVKDGDCELKETKKLFVSSIFNKNYESQNQFVKSKSIQHISNNKQFFFLPQNNNVGVKKQQFRLKRQKTARFFAINELQMNTQCQFDHDQTKSLDNSICHKVAKSRLYQMGNLGKTINSQQQSKTLGIFTENDKNNKMFTNCTQNTLSDSYIQKTKKQQDQKSKFSKPDKQSNKLNDLMKVEQLQTEMQQEVNQRQLREHNSNTVHRYFRARKKRHTATNSQLQQENLIKIYLDDNKQEIKNFKPQRRQSQIAYQIAKRNRTGKHSHGRSKPIVHQSQQQPNFFKLSDL